MQIAFAVKNKSNQDMEILSDAVFKGNLTTYGQLKIRHDGTHGDSNATTITNSEFAFAGGSFSWQDGYKCYDRSGFPYNCSSFLGLINTYSSWSNATYSNKVESCNFVVRGCLDPSKLINVFTVSATNENCSKTLCVDVRYPGTLITNSYLGDQHNKFNFGIGGPYYTKFNLPSVVPASCVKFSMGVEGSTSKSDIVLSHDDIKSNMGRTDGLFSASDDGLLMSRIYSGGCSIPKSIDLYTSGGLSEFIVEKSSGYEIPTTDKFVIWWTND